MCMLVTTGGFYAWTAEGESLQFLIKLCLKCKGNVTFLIQAMKVILAREFFPFLIIRASIDYHLDGSRKIKRRGRKVYTPSKVLVSILTLITAVHIKY